MNLGSPESKRRDRLEDNIRGSIVSRFCVTASGVDANHFVAAQVCREAKPNNAVLMCDQQKGHERLSEQIGDRAR